MLGFGGCSLTEGKAQKRVAKTPLGEWLTLRDVDVGTS